MEDLPLASAGSRILLIATSTYTSPDIVDIPSAARSAKALKEVLLGCCDVREDCVEILCDPRDPYDIGFAVERAAAEATDVLVVAYIGHGMVSHDGDLYLATSRTSSKSSLLPWTAARYNVVRDSIRDSAATSVIVLLDCCFSGRAVYLPLAASTDSVGQAAALARVDGGCVITAAAGDRFALAPEGAEHTAFTGELIEYLTVGEVSSSAVLTLRSAARHLTAHLPAKGFPLPIVQMTSSVDELTLALNPAAVGAPIGELTVGDSAELRMVQFQVQVRHLAEVYDVDPTSLSAMFSALEESGETNARPSGQSPAPDDRPDQEEPVTEPHSSATPASDPLPPVPSAHHGTPDEGLQPPVEDDSVIVEQASPGDLGLARTLRTTVYLDMNGVRLFHRQNCSLISPSTKDRIRPMPMHEAVGRHFEPCAECRPMRQAILAFTNDVIRR